jgi:hypothetical protein
MVTAIKTKHNILTKFAQQQQINYHFQGKQVLDALNITHFSDSLTEDLLSRIML